MPDAAMDTGAGFSTGFTWCASRRLRSFGPVHVNPAAPQSAVGQKSKSQMGCCNIHRQDGVLRMPYGHELPVHTACAVAKRAYIHACAQQSKCATRMAGKEQQRGHPCKLGALHTLCCS